MVQNTPRVESGTLANKGRNQLIDRYLRIHPQGSLYVWPKMLFIKDDKKTQTATKTIPRR